MTWLVLAALAGILALNSGCKGGKENGPSEPTEVRVTGVSVSPANSRIKVGETVSLTATVNPSTASDKRVTWKSGNEAVATVSQSGVVTGVSAGLVAITATSMEGGKVGTASVTVDPGGSTPTTVSVTGVSVSETKLTVVEGHKYQLVAIVSPENATDKTVDWTSSDVNVATVSATGEVTGVKAGTATITVTTKDGKKTATCEVTVTSATIAVTGVTMEKTEITLTEGDTEMLVAKVAPDDATNKKVTWSTSDASVAKVDDNGTVTAVKAGTATITVKTEDGGKTATCKVTVTAKSLSVESVTLDKTSATLEIGGTVTLSATVLPADATNKSVTWSTSDKNVATVAPLGATATVKAQKEGTATITVTTADGGKTATCTVTVKKTVVVGTAVDLGLSVKWADMNVGATKPEEAGDLISWGETSPKEVYSEAAFKWWTPNNKYSAANHKWVLDPEDDAAHVNWGGNWRMPTQWEFEELVEKCTFSQATVNGVTVLKVTGPNGKSIYLPATGYKSGEDTSLKYGERGYYNPCTKETGTLPDIYNKCYIFTTSGYYNKGSFSHFAGLAVRPVDGSADKQVSSITLDKSTLGLAIGAKETLKATITPSDAWLPKVAWTSDDKSIAIVHANDGIVTAVKAGTTTITAWSYDGKKKATCTVTVGPAPGKENGHEWVDMGLSVKWATMAIGASKPEEYGSCFSWGETKVKSRYGWNDYAWTKDGGYTFTKYVTSSKYGTVDNKTVLELADDAAHVNWGGNWRMPTTEEAHELRDNVTATEETRGGVKCYILTSKINGNSIVVPMGGVYCVDNEVNPISGATFWTSSLHDTSNEAKLWSVNSTTGAVYYGSIYRCQGRPVRGVVK